MNKIVDSGAPQGVSYEQYLRSLDGTQTTAATGQGLTGVKPGEAPPTQTLEQGNAVTLSLNAFMTTSGSNVDTTVLLVQVAVAMRDTEALGQTNKINSDMEAKKNQAREKQEKLEEAQKKMDEAEEKKKSGSLIDKIKLAFAWIGAALAVATAAIMFATGVFAPVGAMLIVAAVVAITMAVDATVAATNDKGLGIAGSLRYMDMKAQGKTEEEAMESAQKADMGFRIALAVVGVGAAIASGGASMTGAARAIASTVSEAGKMARVALSISEASASVASAGVDAGRTVVTYQETTLRADAKNLQGEGKKDEAIMQMLDEAIDQALSRLMAVGDSFNAMLDSIMDSVRDRGNTMAKAQFRG